MPVDRRDTSGKKISNGDRYRISFRDKVQAQTEISDTYYVESYKKYNASELEEET